MKSPIKSKPLRNPGESLEKELDDIINDKVINYLVAAAFVILLAFLEWYRWYRQAPPSPGLFTIAAILVSAFAGWKVRDALKRIKNIKLGKDGEKAVGQFLDRLREAGAHVFHDIPGEGFNIDHIVIHATGVYVIETKTLSKPDRGQTRLIFDGESIKRNGFKFDRNPVIQVGAAAKWFSDLILESTGRAFPLQPVVLYPGWFIEATSQAKKSDVWVLNPKALPAFISYSEIKLRDEEIKLCAFHLSRYIRSAT